MFGIAGESNGSVVAAGQAGGKVFVEQLDASGHATASYTGAAGYARGVVVQSNGDIVIAGSSNGAMFAERLTSALKPDTSFGSGGVATAFAGQAGVANGVAVGSDGSVVAAGSVNPVDTRVGVAKFSATGAAQFSKVVDFGSYSLARAVAVQSDGKIVLVGSQNPTQLVNAVIARLTTAGALDTSFAGGRGAFTYSYPGSGYTAMDAVTLQSNGDIVAAGSAAEGPTEVTLRITPAGALDPSFGSGGVATLPAGQNVNVSSFAVGAYGVTLAAGGRIVAAGGYENTGTDVDHALWAFGSGGTAETTFGTGGTVRSPQGAFEACAVTVVPDGSLVTAGNTVTTFPDATPCAVDTAASGLVARYTGFGPVPFPPPPSTALKVSLKGVAKSYKKGPVSKRGLKVGVTCNQACSIKAGLTASSAVARRLHILTTTKRCKKVKGKKRCVKVHKYVAITVASASAKLRSSGSKTLTLKGARLRRALGTFKTVKLTLTVAVTSTSTHKKTTVRRTLKFHR